MADTTTEEIKQYKKYLEKYLSRTPDNDKLIRVLRKLDKLPITIDHLQETGVGKTVNSYRKHGDELGEKARALVNKWKNMVSSEPPSPVHVSPINSVPLLQSETISETPYKTVHENRSHQRAPYLHELSPTLDTNDKKGRGNAGSHITDTEKELHSKPESFKHRDREGKKYPDSEGRSPRQRHNEVDKGDVFSHNRKYESKDSNQRETIEKEHRSQECVRRDKDAKDNTLKERSKYSDHSRENRKRERGDKRREGGDKDKRQEGGDRDKRREDRDTRHEGGDKRHEGGDRDKRHEGGDRDKRREGGDSDKRGEDRDTRHKGGDKRHEGGDKRHEGGDKRHEGGDKRHKGGDKRHEGGAKRHEGGDRDKKHEGGERKPERKDNSDKRTKSTHESKSKTSQSLSESTKSLKPSCDTRALSPNPGSTNSSSHHKSQKSSGTSDRRKSPPLHEGQSDRRKSPPLYEGQSDQKKPLSESTKPSMVSDRLDNQHPSTTLQPETLSEEDDGGLSFEDLLNYDSSMVFQKKKVNKNPTDNPAKKSKVHSLTDRAHKTPSSDKTKSDHKNHKHHKKTSSKDKERSKHESSSKRKHREHASRSDKKPPANTAIEQGMGNATEKRKAPSDLQVMPPPAKQLRLSAEDIASSLPVVTPDYVPMPRPRLQDVETLPSTSTGIVDDDIIGSKSHSRTLIYSGRRAQRDPNAAIPRLFDMCIRVMIDNIDALGETGGVPFYILKPVLEVCSAVQLYDLENQNQHFIGESDELWFKHCKRDFRMCKPDEFESWRELYLRKHDERENKLKSLTASISATVHKSHGESRKTKLAYVDVQAKPPRGVRRQQMKHGTAGPSIHDPLKRLTSHGGSKSAQRPPIQRSSHVSLSASAAADRQQQKPTKLIAPMMAKTLKQIKNLRYGK